MRFARLLLPFLLLVSPVSAINATPVFRLDQYGYMPINLFIFIMSIAVITLIVSYRWNDEMCGAIAIATWFMSMWTSRAIDYLTGTIALSADTISISHTIYHPEILTVFCAICFVISILNEIRIYVLAKQTGESSE